MPSCQYQKIKTMLSSKSLITQKPVNCQRNNMDLVTVVKFPGGVASPNGNTFHW